MTTESQKDTLIRKEKPTSPEPFKEWDNIFFV